MPRTLDESSYVDSGFSRFLRRSIDNPAVPANSLHQYASNANQQSRTINFDQQPTSGNIGDTIRVGNIEIDGSKGRISVYDGADEVVRIGELDD